MAWPTQAVVPQPLQLLREEVAAQLLGLQAVPAAVQRLERHPAAATGAVAVRQPLPLQQRPLRLRHQLERHPVLRVRRKGSVSSSCATRAKLSSLCSQIQS